MIRYLALVALLLLPLRALAETCTFTTSGSWTSATAYSGTVTGCTLSADDSILIASGATATVTADASVTDVDVPMTTGTITVQSGGSLVVERAGGLGIPDAGLLVEPGGTFRPRGSAISYGDATPALVSALSDGGGVDVNTVLPAGVIINCPGTPVGTLSATTSAIVEDCNGNEAGTAGSRAQVGICYPDANVTAQRIGGFQSATPGWPGEGFYPEFLASVSVGDIVVFWDSTNAHPSRDVNAMYEVEIINTNALNRCLIVGVRQGSTEGSCAANAKNCVLADRDIREVTLQSAYVAGQRNVSVDTAAVTSTSHHAGRQLTCPLDYNGDGTIEPGSTQTVAIVATTTGGTDTLRLMPGGFRASVPNGATCWIDYGWQQGDPISVFRPARAENLQNAACVGVGNPVACCTYATAGVGTCGPVICARGSTCDIDFALFNRTSRLTWFPTTTIDNTWLREVGANVQVVLAEGPGPITRLQVTSPAVPSLSSEGHGISPNGGGTSIITDSVIRHWGDDAFVGQFCTVSGSSTCAGGGDPDTAKVYGLTLRRVRAEYAGCAGGSCNVFDENAATGGATTFRATDLLLRDAQERVTQIPAFDLKNTVMAGLIDIRDSAWIASGGTLLLVNGSDSRVEFRDIYDIGRVLANEPIPMWRAHVLADGSFIEEENPGNNAGYILATTGLRATAPMIWSRLLFLDPDTPNSGSPADMFNNGDPPAGLSINDLAIISPNRTGNVAAGQVWRVTSSAPDTNQITIRRATLAMRPGEVSQFTAGIYGTGNDTTFNGGYRTMTQALGAYFWNSTPASAMYIDASDLEMIVPPWCLIANELEWPQGASNTGGVFDSRQMFVDPRVGNFEPVATSALYRAGCGARQSGAKDMWALRVLGHDIYAGHGDTWKVPAGGGGARGPRATP